ncbi:pygopus homolog 1 isoform X1 [Hydra vulgaris]|uniref:pygopus homolog 1 isoform X1 n=2 Tax=Hydra vulgaris TaxID=6087 RepID=UPI001F5E710F|nr:pygopus homolog 1 isoform X1 [Hydra vulgaris]
MMMMSKKLIKKKAAIDNIDQFREEAEDLLSPSETVKMRKTSRQMKLEVNEQSGKDSKTLRKTKSARLVRESSDKMIKDSEKNKKDKKDDSSISKNKKADKDGESKRSLHLKVTRKLPKKKLKKEDNGDSFPVIYPCGICTKEVSDTDEAILCEAGCEFWYHRSCTGMTDIAYQLLTNQDNAEWVCDKCIATKSVPLVKIKSAVMNT